MIPQNFLYIGWNYLFTTQKNSTIKYMSRICFLGIFLATFSLSFIMSIMKGFEKATYTTMQNIYPDLILDAHEDIFDMELIQSFLKQKQYNIISYSPHAISQGILHNSKYDTPPLIIQLKAINADQETKTSNLNKTILNKKTISQTIQNNQLLIGKKSAQALRVLPGEKIVLIYSKESDLSSKKFKNIELIVGGIFETGIDEYDYSLAYCSHDCFQSIFPNDGISQIHLKLADITEENKIKQNIKEDLGVDIYSWKDLYPTLISAMKLESLGMLLILFLIMFIAAINIISVLFMYVYQKQKDIALFVCMGLPQRKIKYIFLQISIYITCAATTFGLIASYCIGLILQTYPIIKLPENIYYCSHLPLYHSFYSDIAIFISILCISCIASLITLKKISKINIAFLIKNK